MSVKLSGTYQKAISMVEQLQDSKSMEIPDILEDVKDLITNKHTCVACGKMNANNYYGFGFRILFDENESEIYFGQCCCKYCSFLNELGNFWIVREFSLYMKSKLPDWKGYFQFEKVDWKGFLINSILVSSDNE